MKKIKGFLEMPLRYLLSLKIDDTTGDDDMGDMERAMENANIQYWEKTVIMLSGKE